MKHIQTTHIKGVKGNAVMVEIDTKTALEIDAAKAIRMTIEQKMHSAHLSSLSELAKVFNYDLDRLWVGTFGDVWYIDKKVGELKTDLHHDNLGNKVVFTTEFIPLTAP